MNKLKTIAVCSMITVLAACATEGSRVIEPTKSATAGTVYHGVKSAIAVGKFDNRSSYQNGIFSEGNDQLASQSKTILISHLQQTGRFSVLDRSNMSEISNEAKIKGKKQNLKGASYVITGDVTEFGRKR